MPVGARALLRRLKVRSLRGVLITDPIAQLKFPWSQPGPSDGYHLFKDLRLQLTLTSQEAQGLMAGYVDVEQFKSPVQNQLVHASSELRSKLLRI